MKHLRISEENPCINHEWKYFGKDITPRKDEHGKKFKYVSYSCTSCNSTKSIKRYEGTSIQEEETIIQYII